jgi:hypothetical protein
MLTPATSENVALPHCLDEREVNSQKPERGGGGVAKIWQFVLDFDEFWDASHEARHRARFKAGQEGDRHRHPALP